VLVGLDYFNRVLVGLDYFNRVLVGLDYFNRVLVGLDYFNRVLVGLDYFNCQLISRKRRSFDYETVSGAEKIYVLICQWGREGHVRDYCTVNWLVKT
jgi:hypothetical protein